MQVYFQEQSSGTMGERRLQRKLRPKLRLIVSSIGTFNYDLADFFCDLLLPVVPDDYCCKDICSLFSQIKNANPSSKFLVSYDVTSLFTNIPLKKPLTKQ